MGNKNSATSSKYRRSYKKQPKKYENNSAKPQNTTTDNSYENNSYRSYRITSPNDAFYFSLSSIFDYYTPEQLRGIVRDPMNNNEILRNISRMLYGCNGILSNTIDYICALPTLDKIIVPYGDSVQKKKRNVALMESTLNTIKHKEFVRDALLNGMIDGVAFYYFETTERPYSRKKIMTDYDVERISEINEYGMNASIISLPVDYTRIIGIRNSSYVLAFNLDYFDNGEGEVTAEKLRKYPKEIRDAYNSKKAYVHKGWVVLDNTKTIVHKIKSSKDEQWGRPLVITAINDILYNDDFIDTKRNVLDEINNRIIYQTFPEGKEKGVSALTKDQQRNQHEAVKGAVLKKNNRGGISFFSVAAGTKINSIEASNTDIFDTKYESNLGEKIAEDLGIASSLLNGSGSGNYSSQENNLQLVSAQAFQWIDQIESELNKCINMNVIKDKKNRVECRYFKTTYVNQKSMIQNTKDLYLQGKGSLALWASAVGIAPEVYFALLDRELEDDIENKYPVHKTSYTYTGDDNSDNKGGRPVAEDSNNPSTLQTRANGTNNVPSPSRNDT